MVRITSGAVPRLRLMSVRTNRGRRFGALVAFALSFLLVASGFYGANSLAQSGEPWDGNPVNGDVEVEGSVSAISLRAGESRSYRIRLSRQPKTNGWWVRIFVNGAQRSDGEYFENGEKVISWVPSVGWQFDVDNHQDPNQPTQWRTITFRAHQDINTPIKIMHEVWEDNTNCPIHERGKITVSSEPTPPDAPTLRATANGQRQIDLSWDAPDDNGASITRYALQVSDNGTSDWTNLASSLGASARSHNHTNLSPGTRKYYRIQARNSRGTGGWSNVADATTQADVPGAPVLRATPNGQTQIDLSWDEPATNGALITRYELQVSDDGNSGWSGLGGQISASTTSYNHTGLSAGTKKYYQIRAYNSEGFGPWKATSATTQATPPDAPTLRATANGQRQIDLSWDAPDDNGADITRYELQVSDDGNSWTNLATNLAASARSYTHSSLSPGTKKYYQIRARNSQGPGAWSEPKNATTQADVPDAPVLRATANGQTKIDLTWDEPDDNGADISRYELQESDDGNSGWSGLGGQISASTTSYNHTGLSAGTKKYYQIRAYNSEGFGPWKATSATTQAGVPDKPVLSASPNGETEINLSWTAPANNGADITHYELQVSDNGTSGWSGLGGRISALTTSYDHTELSAATTKYYRSLARNSQGPGEWSDVKDATTQMGVPDAPVLRATANGQTIIDLSWDAPADNGMDITSYELEVSDDGNSWTPLNSSLGSTDRTFSHTDLSPGTRKYYQIRARNSQGPGAWSEPKSATTQADVPGKPVLTATENGQTKIDLTWDEPDENGADISRYELQVSDDGNSWTNLATNLGSSTRSYSHSSLSPGTQKYYQIRARNSQGPSEWSEPKDATTLVGVPDAPVLRATANGQTIIDLSWDAPADNGMDITSYELEASDDGNSWAPLNSSLGSSDTSYSHTDLSPGTRKYYQIRAHNSVGPGAWSEPKNATTQSANNGGTNNPGTNNNPGGGNGGNKGGGGNGGDGNGGDGNSGNGGDGDGNTGDGNNGNEGKTSTVPGKPVLSATANGETQIDLSWDAPANNGMDITRYELQVSDDGSSDWSGLGGQISASATSYDHTELSAATSKYYRIRAYNSQDPGPWSDVVHATTEARMPDRPEPLRATVDGNRLVLTYDEPLDEGSVPAPGDFTVSTGDVKSVDVSGPRVTLILETPAMPGEEVTLSYSTGEKPIKNITGVEALSFTNMPVENIGKAPVLVDVSVQGDQLTLTYDEPLDETSTPTTGSFTVMVDGASRTVSTVKINGEKVTLTLESAVAPGEEVTLSYTPGSPRIVDLTKIPARPIDNLKINNSTPKVDDNRAQGTNDWLTRFGRTVASQAVETIESRLKSPSMRQASQVTLAGQDVDFFDDDSPLPLAQDDPDFASASRLASRTLGLGGLTGDDPAAGHREISMSDLLLASSFHLASGQNAENGLGASWTAWGRGSRTSFFGDENRSTFQGDVTTGTMGGAFEWGRTMVGVALSHTLGEGYFSTDGRRNDVEARLTGAYPYIRYTVSERFAIWGMFGFGNGEYAQKEEGIEKIETDISMRMGAFGFRSSLVPLGRQIGYDLAVKADVMVVEIEAEEVRDKLLPVDTNTNRFRLLLEGSREYKLGHGASLTPSLVMGVRYDKGDAEEGGGIEFGGGFRFFDPSLDMVIDVSARGLLLHEESRFSEMGVSGSAHFTWGTRKRGLSVRVGSSWGGTASGAERLWSQSSVAGLGAGEENARFEAEVGYGMDAPGGGVIKPYAGLALSEAGSQTYRLGGRLRMGERVSMSLQGERRERVGGDDSHGIGLFGSVRW